MVRALQCWPRCQSQRRRESAQRPASPYIGEAIAHELGFELGPLHWKVTSCAREEHASRGRRPSLRQIAASTSVSLGTLHALSSPRATSALSLRVAGIASGRGR